MPTPAARLVLGGHSFIRQLGNDPLADAEHAAAIVESCLAHGISWFDTTYLPERVALGRALERLGARRQATLLAWNFFVDFGPDDDVGGASPYTEERLDQMRAELRTEKIDILVVHPVPDPQEQRRQEELALSWQRRGAARTLATWMPPPDAPRGPYDLAIAPCNVTTPDASAQLLAYQANGWQTLATSPFVRGWELERIAARSGRPLADVADLLLRFSAFAPGVDRLIVAIRRVEWVARNVESLARGPLSQRERAQLWDWVRA